MSPAEQPYFQEYSSPLVICFLVVLFLTGCASSQNKIVTNPQRIHEEVSLELKAALCAEKEGIRIEIFPLIDESISKSIIGASPKVVGLMPFFMRIQNSTSSPIKVNLIESVISFDGKPYSYIFTEEAAERVRSSGMPRIGAAVFLGVIGGIMGGAVGGAAAGGGFGAIPGVDKSGSSDELTVSELYHQQSFKPSLIDANRRGAGMVFFHMASDEVKTEKFTLLIPVSDLYTGNIVRFEFFFTPDDFKARRERKR